MTNLELLRRSRWIAFGTLLSLAPLALGGCGTEDLTADEEAASAESVDEIANVNQSAVKRQSIGNCWIYATTGWLESMHRARTGTEINVSESYLTYWDWFTKITTGSGVRESTATREGRPFVTRTISTGGSWQLATTIMRQRGVVMEADFIPEEATSEASARQASAETAINAAMSQGGELATREARRNPALVLRVLNRAWGLSTAVASTLSRAFGLRGERRIDNASLRAMTAGTFVRAPSAVNVTTAVRNRSTRAVTRVQATLADVIPGGRYAWAAFDYPGAYAASERPAAMRRLLTALNQDQPVLVSWLVDFNALDAAGAFRTEELERRGMPGRQGGHITVLDDYQVTLRNGRVLAAGTDASPADREAALDGTVQFLRVKNSWGVSRSDRASSAGYYDLHLNYLHGPIDWVDDRNPTAAPTDAYPLNEFVIPQGF